VIKQELREDSEVQATRATDTVPFAQDSFLSPFVGLVDDEILDDTTTWSGHRPHDSDGDSLGSLLCNEDAST
jgi:hypothetical protein